MVSSGQVQMGRGVRKRRVIAAVVVTIVFAVILALTTQLSTETYLGFLASHRFRIMAAEIAVFGILIVELAGGLILQQFRERNALQRGIAVRAILRVVAYLVLGFIAVSVLAANPAFAIGVGSVTGVVVAFSAQSLLSNVIAGMFIALERPFSIGDEVTAMGVTGKVVEIGLMRTLIDTGERWVYVPSTLLITTAIQRTKESISYDDDQI